jgi:hypothetical protein
MGFGIFHTLFEFILWSWDYGTRLGHTLSFKTESKPSALPRCKDKAWLKSVIQIYPIKIWLRFDHYVPTHCRLSAMTVRPTRLNYRGTSPRASIRKIILSLCSSDLGGHLLKFRNGCWDPAEAHWKDLIVRSMAKHRDIVIRWGWWGGNFIASWHFIRCLSFPGLFLSFTPCSKGVACGWSCPTSLLHFSQSLFLYLDYKLAGDALSYILSSHIIFTRINFPVVYSF